MKSKNNKIGIITTRKTYISSVKCLFILLFLLVIVSNARAQYPSLNADDFAEFQIKDDAGNKYGITLLKSSTSSFLWYYIPNAPRLVEKKINGVLQPEFTLLTYGVNNPQHPEIVSTGGELQFTATYQLEKDVVDKIRSHLIDSLHNPDIQITALPPKSAEVALYLPSGADSLKFFASAPQGSGIAPIYATQNMAFTIPLTAVGTDVLDALTKSNTGIGMAITFDYLGSVDAGFTVNVNYKKVIHHYSTDEHIKASASYLGLFGGSYERSKQEIYNYLHQDKSIDIIIDPSEHWTVDQITDKFLSPILQRINQEILKQADPPNIVPASAASPGNSGKYFSAGYSIAIKSENAFVDQTEKITFKLHDLVERKTIISGFLNIAKYPDQIKKDLLINVTGTKYQTANFLLPPVNLDPQDAKDLNINNLNLQIQVQNHDGTLKNSQVFQWTPQTNTWSDFDGHPRRSASFYLGYGSVDDAKNQKFKIIKQLSTNNLMIPEAKVVPYDPGQSILDFLYERMYDEITIDPLGIKFSQLDNTSQISKIEVVLNFGDQQIKRTIRPIQLGGKLVDPNPIQLVMDKKLINDAKLIIKLVKSDGSELQWIHNGEPLSNSNDYQFNLGINQFK